MLMTRYILCSISPFQNIISPRFSVISGSNFSKTATDAIISPRFSVISGSNFSKTATDAMHFQYSVLYILG